MGRGSGKGKREGNGPEQWSLKRNIVKGGCCGGERRWRVPVVCTVDHDAGTANVGSSKYRLLECGKIQHASSSIRFEAKDARTGKPDVVELFGEGTTHKDFAMALVAAQKALRRGSSVASVGGKSSAGKGRRSVVGGGSVMLGKGSAEKAPPPQLEPQRASSQKSRQPPPADSETEEDDAAEEYDGEPLKEQVAEMKDLISVYDAMKSDYMAALGKKREALRKKVSDAREKTLNKLEESLGVILMGRKALLGDLQEAATELENAVNWHQDHDPENADLEKAEQRLEAAQSGPLAEDDHFGVDEDTLSTADFAELSTAQFPGMSQLGPLSSAMPGSSQQPKSRLSKSAGQKRSSYMAEAKSSYREAEDEKTAALAEAKAKSANEAAKIAAFKLDLAMKAEKIALQKQLSFEKALARTATKRISEKDAEEQAAMLADVKAKSAKEAAALALRRRKSFEIAAADADKKRKSAMSAAAVLAAEAARAKTEDADVDEHPEDEEEDYEKKENELDDISGALGIVAGKKFDYEKIDLNVRTIVHGFEDKVFPGSIAKVLKPKNEKNWMLIEVKRTGEAHWVPAWAVSKGYFRTLNEEEGVCKKDDLVEYLKGPLDGWCLVRNVTQHSKYAQWLHIDCLPDQAVEPKPKKDEKIKFQAFHDYTSKDGKLDLKKGTEMQLLSGPKNGWIGVVFLDGSKRKGYVPYWVMPHEFRTDDAGGKKKVEAAKPGAAEKGRSSTSTKKSAASAAQENKYDAERTRRSR